MHICPHCKCSLIEVTYLYLLFSNANAYCVLLNIKKVQTFNNMLLNNETQSSPFRDEG